jgi:TRAP-type C4-dicarboxylate transport system substrate-binding protein
MKIAIARALLAAGALSLAAPALPQETTLIFATVNPPNAHLTVNVLVPWAQRVNERGKGIVRLDIRDGLALANLGNAYDRVLSDVVQVAWGTHSAVGGKFRKTEVIALPFVAPTSAEEGSVALWRLYKAGMLDSDYDEVIPLYLCQIANSGVQFAKPPKGPIDTLAGYKMIVSGRIPGQSAARLGATPASISLNEMYEAIQRGTVDGVFTGWTAFQPFKLAEVTTYHVDVTLSGASGYVFMSRKKWDALPPAVKKVLEENSGEAQSKAFGAFWDRIAEETRADLKKNPKHTVVSLTPEQQKKWQEAITPVVADWAKSTPDGDKVLSTYRGLVQQVRAGR